MYFTTTIISIFKSLGRGSIACNYGVSNKLTKEIVLEMAIKEFGYIFGAQHRLFSISIPRLLDLNS